MDGVGRVCLNAKHKKWGSAGGGAVYGSTAFLGFIKTNPYVDLYASEIRGNQYSLLIPDEPSGRLERAASMYFPLRHCELGGVSFPCPAQPEAALVADYGANWKAGGPGYKDNYTDVVDRRRRRRLRLRAELYRTRNARKLRMLRGSSN